MITAIIIDDEKNGAEVLQLLLEQNCENIHILSIENSAEQGIEAIKKINPDLIFLDIEMPTATGFDVIERTPNLNYEVIFTTAYDHYAIKALKANATDYLLKPIDLDELINSVNQVEKRINNKRKNNQGNLEETILNIIHKNKKISIPTTDGVILVDLIDVIRFEAESNYTKIFLKNNRKLMASKTLKFFEDQLFKNNFCRVHSSHLINIDEIERYIKGDGGILIMKDGNSIPVSRANKQDLLKKIGL